MKETSFSLIVVLMLIAVLLFLLLFVSADLKAKECQSKLGGSSVYRSGFCYHYNETTKEVDRIVWLGEY